MGATPSEGCFSGVRGPVRTTNQTKTPKILDTKIVHTSGKIVDFGGRHFRFLESKNVEKIFYLCPHIELNTQNPTPIFKIAIYYTKHTNNAKLHSIVWKLFEKIYIYIYCILYKLHNSYFVFFVNVVTWGLLVFCIFISLYITRVGLLHV